MYINKVKSNIIRCFMNKKINLNNRHLICNDFLKM